MTRMIVRRMAQEFATLDPPSPACLTAWRTRQAVLAQASAWPETPAGITAHLAFLFTVQGEGDAARQAVANWLVDNGIHTPVTATEQAAGLAEDIAALRQITAREGYRTARDTAVGWYTGMTGLEADRVLGCAGIAGG